MKEVRIADEQADDPEKVQVGHLTEHSETERLESAAEQISKMEQLRPDVWSRLTETQKEWSLRRVGEKLSRVYECPAPPFIASSLPPGRAGGYSDWNYLTRLDHQEIRSNDVHEALDSYCHEFRHAYQNEQAGRYDSGYLHRQEFHLRSYRSETEGRFNSPFRHLCHDEAKAAQWAENLRPGNYVSSDVDPERYRGQPVEKDAWDFAGRITDAVRRRQQGHTGM